MHDEEHTVLLDHVRSFADAQLNRIVIEALGTARPFSEQHAAWCTMPIRLVHDAAGGLQVEIGPYTFPRQAVDDLASALSSYHALLWSMEAATGSEQPDGS